MSALRIATVDADWLEQLVGRVETSTNRLIESQQALADKQHDELLTLEEVCRFTRLSANTVRLRMSDMPVVADGPQLLRFYRSEVMAWCKAHTVAYYELVEQRPHAGKKTKPAH